MLVDASEVLDMIKGCQKRTEALRTRFEDHYDLKRLEPFEMGKDTGEWVNHTSNRPAYDLTNIQDALANSKVKWGIPIGNENEKKREILANTEKFVWGCLNLSDSIATSIPEGQSFHDSMSTFVPMRGLGTTYAHIINDDDGKTQPIIESWDTNNVYWISGSQGLVFAAYSRLETADGINKEYGLEDDKKIVGDDKGLVIVYKVIDQDEIGEMAEYGGSTADPKKYSAWIKEPFAHNLDHIPVFIRPNGSSPLILSNRHDDTFKDLGVSWATDNDKTYKTESMLKTYFLTAAARDAKEPIFVKYDSSQSNQTPEIEGNPQKAGSVVFLDVAKGQDVASYRTKDMSQNTVAVLQSVQAELESGSKSPVNYGEVNRGNMPAAGINLLAHISMTNMKTFMKTIEKSYEWLGHELVSQFKSGNFSSLTLQGVDGQNRRFKVDIKPEDISDEWEFECKLLADLPTDEVANVSMAVETTQGNILSFRTARDRFHLSDDPDYEQEIIDNEKANNIGGITLRRIEKALRDDGDEEGADFIRQAIEEMGQNQQKGVASQPGSRGIPSPRGEGTARNAPGNMLQRLRQRMGGQ